MDEASTRDTWQATSVRESAPRVLMPLTSQLGWDVGELWEMRDGEITCTATWGSAGITACDGESFAPGRGMPGTAWITRKPMWITDVENEDDLFPRAERVRAQGLRTACAFPVLTGREETRAVLLFMSRARRRPDLDAIESMTAAAAALARIANKLPDPR